MFMWNMQCEIASLLDMIKSSLISSNNIPIQKLKIAMCFKHTLGLNKIGVRTRASIAESKCIYKYIRIALKRFILNKWQSAN